VVVGVVMTHLCILYLFDCQLQTSTKTPKIAYIPSDKEKPGKRKTKQQSTVQFSSVQFSLRFRFRMRTVLHNYKECDFTSDEDA
jgi:hypothetical protein